MGHLKFLCIILFFTFYFYTILRREFAGNPNLYIITILRIHFIPTFNFHMSHISKLILKYKIK
jgi:hypothetical protein